MSGERYVLAAARAVGAQLVRLLEPHCKRIEIAGSIRCQRPDVGDIELLCISKVTSVADLFGDIATNCYMLDEALGTIVEDATVLQKRLDKRGRATFGEQNKLMVHVPSGIPVDAFSASVENWGMSQLVRTGPVEFNRRVMARFRELGMKGHAYGGVTDPEGNEIACPDEETVFRLLGWPWMPPEERV